MSAAAKSPSTLRPSSLGKRVLARALRDKQRLLSALVVGDVIGARVSVSPTPAPRVAPAQAAAGSAPAVAAPSSPEE